jgi:hypothetical protein
MEHDRKQNAHGAQPKPPAEEESPEDPRRRAAMSRRAPSRRGAGEAGGEAKSGGDQGGQVHDLGLLDKPGDQLKGSNQSLAVGDSLRFSFGENQIWGINTLIVTPPDALQWTDKQLEDYKHHVLGSMSKHQFTLTVSPDAKPGEKIHVQTYANHQSQGDPGWDFSFDIEVK